MNSQYDKRFLISGLIMLVLGLLAPIYSPYALADKCGHIHAKEKNTKALVFFSFAWMWPHLSLPKFSKSIATVCLYISLWANWIGTLFVGIFGAGKEQYIVNQDLVPGAKGFWNIATLLLINLSQLAVLAVVLAIIGFLGWVWTAKKERIMNFISLLLLIAILVVSLFQTFNPQYSNG